MTVVQPNSISGINSITAQNDSLSIHKSDGTLLRNIVSDSGISTFSQISVAGVSTFVGNIGLGTIGTASTIFASGNAAFSGIVTASEFSVGTAVTIGKTNGNASFAGVVTATSFVGDGSGLTGVASTDNIITSTDATFNANVSIGGSLTVDGTFTKINTTILDVEDKTVGVASTASKTSATQDGAGLVIYGQTDVNFIYELNKAAVGLNTALSVAGVVSATSYTGDGSSLTGISVGITTTERTGLGNTTVFLDLSNAQHHTITLAAGISTIDCTGGSVGESHSLVLINPSSVGTGVTVGFATDFLFPSGSVPAMPTGANDISLISFVVKQTGAGGTEVLASAGLDYQ